MVCDYYRIALYKPVSYHKTLLFPAGTSHVRPYNSIEAVAAVGSKYLMGELGEENSLGSDITFAFLDDRPAELREALRWREDAGRLEDDIAMI
jgi:hypothetical protein